VLGANEKNDHRKKGREGSRQEKKKRVHNFGRGRAPKVGRVKKKGGEKIKATRMIKNQNHGKGIGKEKG